MKRFTGSVLLSAIVLASSPVLAADMAVKANGNDNEPVEHWLTFTGIDVNSGGSFFGFGGFQFAPGKGGLDESGLRFWFLGGGGRYRYPANNETIHGTFWDTDALVGYSIERDNGSLAFYGGLNFQSHRLSTPDPENPVQGDKVGAKFQVNAWYNPTPITLLYGEGSYSTAFQTYYATGKYGYSFTGGKTLEDKQFYIGPQITLLGNERYQEWRIGAHVTSLNLGKVDFEIGAGFQHNTDNGSGAYALFELNTKF
ncbi:MAG TPA: cellulose biosynthesis protein BcsS [Xanthobacteraceae bacterium]|nr:cellulose biosynthesis protein BcsS [Xanthobacteraceae bacterium]